MSQAGDGPSRGFVYVATGEGYVREAAASAASLRRHHPGASICLVTDAAPAAREPFDCVVVRDDAERRPIDKLLAIHCPYDRAVFLDTDTQVFGDLTPLFEVLDRFDLAALQDINRGWNYTLPGVPLSFSEFSTGVIAFKKGPEMEAFFRKWRENHEAIAEEQKNADQPAFRQTVYDSNLRIAPLPSEFHFITNFPNMIHWNVRLIHARGDLDRMQRQVDEVMGNRAFIPDVGVVPVFTGRIGWLRTMGRTAWRMLRIFLRVPTYQSANHPNPWWTKPPREAPPAPKSP